MRTPRGGPISSSTIDAGRAGLESFIRAEYERCHPEDTFDDLKQRARFSKEDKGLLRDWMALAAQRAALITVAARLPVLLVPAAKPRVRVGQAE